MNASNKLNFFDCGQPPLTNKKNVVGYVYEENSINPRLLHRVAPRNW